VAVTLGLTGCTDGEPGDEVTAPSFEPASPEPSEPEAAPRTVEPSVEPTQAAPPLPDAATEQTPEGAVAFTEWWFETLNYAYATGDTDPLAEASIEGCETCETAVENIASVYEQGGLIEGGEVLLTSALAPPGQSDPSRIEVSVLLDQAEANEVTAVGDVVPFFGSEDAVAVTMLAFWDGDSWGAAGVVPVA
jgi:hypothetical protein